jgi:hypothetical protein
VDDFRATAELARIYHRLQPDIIHLHTSKAAALGRLAPGKNRARIVYTMHGYDQLRVGNRKFLGIDRWLSRTRAALVAVSAVDEKAMVADGYPVPRLIPNGVKAPVAGRDDEAARIIKALTGRGLPVVLVIAWEGPVSCGQAMP